MPRHSRKGGAWWEGVDAAAIGIGPAVRVGEGEGVQGSAS